MIDVDVLVVGAGPTGQALALHLAEEGFEVCLADASAAPPSLPTVGYDLRVSTLNRASEAYLDSLGVWAGLPRERLAAFHHMHVWDAGGRGNISFDAGSLGTSCLGHVVENATVQRALAERIDDLGSVRQLRSARLEELLITESRAEARVGSERVSAALVVGADGARSTVREMSGITTRSRSYDQSAVVANLRMAEDHEATAWQRFLPTGPLAVLPLPGDLVSIVWSTTEEEAAHLLQLDDAGFRAAVSEAFDWRLGGVVWCGERASFPLVRVEAASYTADRVALIGDAAHTIHPLAGQGVNLGFMDACALGEVLCSTRSAGRDPGGRVALRRYERWRKSHNLGVQNLMDALRWLFGSTEPARTFVRNTGLGWVDRAGPVKRQLMRLASGLDGDLPPRARALR